MKEPTWIRMVKLKQRGIPAFALPDTAVPVQLAGKFHVRWPDETISLLELKSKMVHTRLDDDIEVSGLYTYFETTFNGMDIIYNLHEVELRADEVAKSLAPTKRKAA